MKFEFIKKITNVTPQSLEIVSEKIPCQGRNERHFSDGERLLVYMKIKR